MKNIKRILSLALTAIMVCGTVVVGSSAAFNDTDKIVNQEAAIVTSGLGIFAGTTDGNFDPTGNVTRAQMAAIISKMVYGSEINADSFKGTGKFSDTASFEGGWAEGYINLCVNLGVVSGYGDGTFRPGNAVTTAEATTMLINALKIDAGEGQWPMTVMAAAETAKLFGDLSPKPGTNVALTRDQLAVMIWNALNYSAEGKNVYKVGDKKFDTATDAYIYTMANGGTIEVLAGEDSLATSTFELITYTGIVTGNQASGLEYTEINNGELLLDLETGLDMLGHYVTAYYAEAWESEEEPGVAYCLFDEAKYIVVNEPEVDTKKEFVKFFGKALPVYTGEDITVYTMDGEYNIESGLDLTDIYDETTWTAAEGTYVVFEGKVIAYFEQETIAVSKVNKVTTTAGKEAITLGAPYGLLNNTEDEDEIVEYDGVTKGDFVIVKNVQDSVYCIEKLSSVEGKISRVSTNEYDETVITVNGKKYTASGLETGVTGLANNTELINFNNFYEIFVYGDKYIGWKGAASTADVSDVIFVLGSYNVVAVDTYGNDVTSYYAQGINMEGKEVSTLIGIEYAADALEDLGVTSLEAGYYTFELSKDKDEKKANIMKATALAVEYNDEEPSIYVGAIEDKDFDSKTTNVRTAAGELAFITEVTKFVIVEGTMGEALDIAVMTGTIRMDDVTAPVVLAQDDNGNVTLEVVVIGVDSLGVMAEDYIFVSEAQLLTKAENADGLTYDVYFTNEGAVKEIAVETEIAAAGFYTYTYDAAENVYELTEADEDNTVVYVDEEFQSLYNGSIISSNIEAFKASEAKIFDARAEKIIAENDIPAIESLEDMNDATLAEYVVTFSALVDEDENVTTIVVTAVDEAE